jgi:hypothetical protein
MNENLSSSPFYELRHAIKNNPIVLAKDHTDIMHYDFYIYDRLAEGGFITIEGEEVIQHYRQLGYCNFVYIDVSFI